MCVIIKSTNLDLFGKNSGVFASKGSSTCSNLPLALLVRLFSVCAVVPIFITFGGVSEFQDTYHGFLYFLTFLVFLSGFFILLV